MRTREILVCVTFREFDGSTNARIHEEFLKAIKKQVYQNFRLVVTNYRERNVKKTLDRYKIPYYFHQSKRKDCSYSISEVIQQSFKYLKEGKHIILWTNTDNIFEPNFFQEIIDHFKPGMGGTSYPHMTYRSLKDFKQHKPVEIFKEKPIKSFYQLDPNYWVIDTIFVDGDIFLDKQNQRLFSKYIFIDRSPGIAQPLCFGFFAKNLINLIYKTKIAIIKNVRSEEIALKQISKNDDIDEVEAQKRYAQYHAKKTTKGFEMLQRFCKEMGINKNLLPQHPLKKININRKYKVVGDKYQKLIYQLYLAYWYVNNVIRIIIESVTAFSVRIIGASRYYLKHPGQFWRKLISFYNK